MHYTAAALLLAVSTVTPALASNDPTYTVTFYTSPHCKDQGAGPFTNPIEDVLCVHAPNAVSVYMNFTENYGNGVGELIPLEDGTTCQSTLPSYDLTQCNSPSATGCYGFDKNDYWVFTGGDLEGSCETPSGPSPGPLPGGSGGGDKLKRTLKRGIRFG